MRLTLILNCTRKIPKSFSNFPDKYIKKQTDFVLWETPNLPQYRHRVYRWKREAYYDRYRPWEKEFQDMNAQWVYQPKIWVEPIEKFYMFKGDRVEVLAGKDKGKQGIINYVVQERNWVFVEGLNIRRVLRFKTQNYPGTLVPEEMPLLVPRDVALVDPTDKRVTTIKWKFDEEGKEVRVSERTGRIIPIPLEAFSTADYKSPEAYVEKEKDTDPDEVQKVTFQPKLKTFEMDIMDEFGIEEKRKPRIMFWY
jgi:ribosomal protein L24